MPPDIFSINGTNLYRKPAQRSFGPAEKILLQIFQHRSLFFLKKKNQKTFLFFAVREQKRK